MKQRIIQIFLSSFILLGLLLSTGNVVVASAPLNPVAAEGGDQSSCSTIQVVLMIDQSGSMNRNDPYGYRYEEPIHITNILATNYMNARTETSSSSLISPLKIQFAVIQFASTAKITVDWMSISPSDDESWQDIQQRIVPHLSPDTGAKQKLFEEIGNGTNFVNAFSALENLFNRTDAPVDSCPKRLVLLLTDGSPDFGEEVLEEDQLKAHMKTVESMADLLLTGENDALYVTGLNVANDDYWINTKGYWDNVANNSPEYSPTRVEKVNIYAEIGTRMSDIIHTMMGDFTTKVEPGDLVVPPYLESYSLTFYKPDSANTIKLSDEKGLITEARDDVDVTIRGTEGAIQTITVHRPSPGIYKLATTAKSDDYIITQQMIFLNARLTQPASAMQQFNTGFVALELIDGEGNPLPKYENKKYDLHITSRVFTDSGDVWDLALTHQDDGLLKGHFMPFAYGLHHVSMQAEVVDDANKSWVIFDESRNIFDFYVSEVALDADGFEFISDRAEDSCPLVQSTGFTALLPLINVDSGEAAVINQPVNWVVDAPDGVEVNIVGPDAQGTYTLDGISEVEGPQPIRISASVVDTKQKEDIPLGEIVSTPYFKPSLQYDITIERSAINKSLKGLGLILHRFWNDLRGKENSDLTVIGRQFFFRPQKVLVTAILKDSASQKPVDTMGIIPDVSLIPLEETGLEYSSQWVSKGEGEFTAVFEKLPFGDYVFSLPAENTSCTVVVSAQVGINLDDRIQVAPGLSEYLLILAGIFLLAGLISWAIKWLVCKVVNPIKGYGRFYNRDGSPRHTPLFSAPNSSCVTVKVSKAMIEREGVKRIKINSMRQRKGGFALTVFFKDGNKETKIIDPPGTVDRIYDFKHGDMRFVYKERVQDLPNALPNMVMPAPPNPGSQSKPFFSKDK